MRKVLLILICFIYSIACHAHGNDSIFISSIEYQVLNEKIAELKIKKAELNKDIERIDSRVSDWYINLAIGGGIFIFLLGGLFTIQWINNKKTAKDEAEKGLESINDKILSAESNLDEISENYLSVSTAFNLLKEEIENTQS